LEKEIRRGFGEDWEMKNRTARNKPVEKITGYRRLGKARRDYFTKRMFKRICRAIVNHWGRLAACYF
jgi:hypothetical protein